MERKNGNNGNVVMTWPQLWQRQHACVRGLDWIESVWVVKCEMLWLTLAHFIGLEKSNIVDMKIENWKILGSIDCEVDEIGPGVEVQSSELRHLSGTTCIIGGFMAPQFSIAMIPHSLLFCCLLFMCKDGKNLQFWKRLLFFYYKKIMWVWCGRIHFQTHLKTQWLFIILLTKFSH